MKRIWRFWAKALGPKQGESDREADAIAIVRTLILFAYMTTNLFIVMNAWSNLTAPKYCCVPCSIQQKAP